MRQAVDAPVHLTSAEVVAKTKGLIVEGVKGWDTEVARSGLGELPEPAMIPRELAALVDLESVTLHREE